MLLSFQVDANAIFVDYSNITVDIDYLQSVSDLRVAARYVTKYVIFVLKGLYNPCSLKDLHYL
jgi:uncharacterized ubiquitin-like protein YukD